MNLNLQILKEDLSDIVLVSRIIDDKLDRRLAFAVIFNGEEHPLNDRLYLINASELPLIPDLPGGVGGGGSFLCIGSPPVQYPNNECNILAVRENISMNALLARVTELFYFYNSWELELQKANAGNTPIKKLGMLSEPVFKNPLSLHDASMKYMFHVFNKDWYTIANDYDYIVVEENAYLELEDLNLLKYDKEFAMAEAKKEPAVYSPSFYGYRSLYFNIFLSGKYVARLLVDEINRLLTDRDFALIKVLGEAVKANLEIKAAFDQWYPKHLDEIFAKLLDHQPVGEDEIRNVLSETGWNTGDTYFCVTIEPSEFDVTNNTLFPLADRLSSLAPSNCYRVHDNAIIYLFNTSAVKTNREKVQNRLLPHLRDSFLKAGISVPFSNFINLYSYYQQTLISLKLGKKKNQDYWYYRFDDYVLDYIIESCTGVLVPESLCPEGLLRLRRHDCEKGTDYVRILGAYLQNNMNAVQTQHCLNIHRNTFYSKLNRLREILDMNIEDYNTRLRLLIALRL
jgi:hypothetical protein